ncbi:hypothetical protein V1514DRAFT_334447 [Lipomyces japonicus]|uniref:uncharacterized protein n=1 Tax=Lipomyces japonicus TaxID=56871 RepID=UPI0034CEBACE
MELNISEDFSFSESLIAHLESETARLTKSLAETADELKVVTTQNLQLINQIEEIEHESELRGSDAEKWRRLYQNEKRLLDDTRDQVATLHDGLKSRDENNHDLAFQKVCLQQELDIVRNHARELTEQCRTLEKRNDELHQHVNVVEDQNNLLLKELDTLNCQIGLDSSSFNRLLDRNRRNSDDINGVRFLSSELAMDEDEVVSEYSEKDRDESSITDYTDHGEDFSDIKSNFEALRLDMLANFSWLTPDGLHQFKNVVENVLFKSGSFNIDLKTLNSTETLLASLIKQHFLIKELKDVGGSSNNIVSESHVDPRVDPQSASLELPKTFTLPAIKQTNWLPRLHMSIFMLCLCILLLLVAIIAGFFIRFALFLSVYSATSGLLHDRCEFQSALILPWWVENRFPGVEKVMFTLNRWLFTEEFYIG